MLSFHIDADFYGNARKFIIGAEGFKNGTIYPDTKTIPTIGYGYALAVWDDGYEVRHTLTADLSQIGIALTDAQNKLLDQIVKKLNAKDTTGAKTLIATLDAGVRDITPAEAEALFKIAFDRALKNVETRFEAILKGGKGKLLFAEMIGSTELIAITSLGYNNPGKLIGPNLSNALWNGNRAEAWFEIRYGSNGDKLPGIAKRRYMESALFGLYDNPTSTSLDEAFSIYRMYTKHRDDIFKYEATYGVNPDGSDGSKGNYIAKANEDLQAAGMSSIAANELDDALMLAAKQLVAEYSEYIVDPVRGGDKSINVLNIQVTNPSNKAALVGEDTITKTGSNADLLIGTEGQTDYLYGQDGNDVLIGHSGDDVLVGGKGNDVLVGGAGNDTYIWNEGDGNDRIIDSDKKGRIIVKSGTYDLYAGGYFEETAKDSGVWTSPDGKLTLTHHSPWRIITEDGSEIELGDFQDGDYGIHLHEASQILQAPETTRTIEGDIKPDDLDIIVPSVYWDYINPENGQTSLVSGADGSFIPTGAVMRGAPLPQDVDPDTGLATSWKIIYTLHDDLGNPLPGTHESHADILFGSEGNDLIHAGEQDDTVSAKGGDDIVEGGNGNDMLYGEAGNDILRGEAGKDQLDGGVGNDRLEGGGDKDLLVGGEDDDKLLGGADSDIVQGGTGDDLLFADSEIDTAQAIIQGNSQQGTGQKGDWLNGGEGGDIVIGAADNDVLFGGAGDDVLIGGAGDDVITGDDDFTAASFDWSVTDYGNTFDRLFRPINVDPSGINAIGNDILYGGNGNDMISGEGGDDVLYGEADDDVMAGDDGNDMLMGGSGDDTMTGDYGSLAWDSNGAIVVQGDDYLDGGDGNDWMQGEGGNDELFGGDGNDTLIGDADHLDSTQHGNDYLDGEGGDDLLAGQGGDDELFGGEGSDQLEGGAGNDYLDGEAGNDLLFGGEGDDQLVGGAGDDQIVSDAGNDDLSGDEGSDQLFGADGDDMLDGGTGDDRLQGGSGNDTLLGGDGNDILFGEAGNDTLDGGDGADYLAGGAGDDTYLNVGADDMVFDEEGQNIIQFSDGIAADDIDITSSYVNGMQELAMSIGGHELVRTAAGQTEAGQSYQFADGTQLGLQQLMGQRYFEATNLAGTAGDDVLHGYAGDDILSGGDGNDRLLGYGGNDHLEGGDGSDVYVFNRGDGFDTIADNGTDGAVDTLQLGSDIGRGDVIFSRYANGDLVMAINGTGTDGVRFSGWYNTSGNRIESINFGDGSVLTPDELSNLPIMPLTGTEGDDVLTGSTFAETIEGLAGNDVLDGGAGNDTLIGGEGVDAYLLKYGMGKDTLIDASAGGNAIRLAPGLAFADLDAVRAGNDLFVHIHGTEQGVLLQDYYADPQGWTVQNEAGEQLDVVAVVEATGMAAQQDTVDTMWRDYLTQIKNSFTASYLSQGYQVAADGSLYRHWSLSDGAKNVSAYVYESGTTIQTTYRFFSGGMSTATNNYPYYQWYTNEPAMYEATAVLNERTVETDEQVIYSQAGEANSRSFRFLTAKLVWQPAVNWYTQSRTTDSSSGFIYGPYDGEPVGTVENVREIYSMAGYAYGKVTDLVTDGSATVSAGARPQYVRASLSTYGYAANIEEIVAGASDNEIHGNSYTLVDAGSGNDTVSGAGLAYGGAGNDAISNGNILIGGIGDDTLVNGQVLLGGEGDDFMDGGYGATRYIFEAGQIGRDLIKDSGGYDEDYKDWYYNSIEWEDWRESEAYGGMYAVDNDGISYFTYDELNNIEWLANYIAEYPEAVRYVEPLPPLPMPAANDFEGLQDLLADVLPGDAIDAVELPADVLPADLNLSWGETWQMSPVSGLEEPYRTLILSWNNGASQVQLVIPHADDPLGSGVEEVRFADGTLLSMVDLVAMAPPVSSLDPREDGHVTGSEQADFLSGTLAGDAMDGLGEDDELYGYEGNDVLDGGAGDDLLDGGAGNDVLAGGLGDDTYVLNAGAGVDRIDDAGGNDTILFGPDITPDSVSLGLGSLLVRFGSNGDSVHIEGFDPADALGSMVIENFRFADGTTLTHEQLLARGFDMAGGGVVSGTDLADRIAGGGDDDILVGGMGDDVLTGGLGGDELSGGQGGDVYVLNLGDGEDTVFDSAVPGENNLVVFGDGIVRDSLRFELEPGGLRIRYSDADSVLLAGYMPAVNQTVAQIEFADGSTASLDELMNQAPEVADWLVDQVAMEDSAFSFTLPDTAFADPDASDALRYMATRANGSVLPEWLRFDSATRTFSGTPVNGDVGEFAVKVVATDRWGKRAEQTFNLEVANVNDAPDAMAAIGEQLALEDVAYTLQLPADAFADVDAGDALSYTVTLADGSALPGWLLFDEATRSFSGTPTNQDVGAFEIRVTATDLAGASASTAFSLEVQNVNDAPVLVSPWGNHAAIEDADFTFTVPADAFVDVDQGDSLAYSAKLADGSPLPGWLAFDPATRTFSGTPANGDVGTVSVSVTAMDLSGASASSLFDLGVVNRNDAPVAASALADQDVAEDAAFSFTLPVDAFSDVDAGDALSYTVTLADGAPLPQWLAFDAATRTFSGTPANADVGALDVTVTATDLVGATASSTFALAVVNVNDAPVLAQAVADQMAMEDAPFSFTVPASAFTDEDFIHGDSLSYRAALADGTALPGWLSFDAATQTFSGTPVNADVGAIQVKVVATDASGLAAESVFSIAVGNVNDIPVLVTPLADRQAAAKSAVSWQIPAGSFADVDQGDALSYSAQLADGSALPSWLRFDAATQTFSGQVPNNAKGSLDIRVIASDGHGAESVASDVFRVNFAQGSCGGHGNEGVGNGQDAPPPGHDYDWNDGPGTSPGQPGSKDGRHSQHGKDGVHDDDHDKDSGWNDRNKLFRQPYLDPKKLDQHYEEFAGKRQEADTCATVARWIEVDLAVARRLAMEDKSLPWLHHNHGADIAALHQASAGFLGSKHGYGVDAVSLVAAAPLKTFRGLREGMERIG